MACVKAQYHSSYASKCHFIMTGKFIASYKTENFHLKRDKIMKSVNLNLVNG